MPMAARRAAKRDSPILLQLQLIIFHSTCVCIIITHLLYNDRDRESCIHTDSPRLHIKPRHIILVKLRGYTVLNQMSLLGMPFLATW